jgi:hypothetical protein
VTPYSKVVTKAFEGRYEIVLQWRGDATARNSMGIEFHYRVRELSRPEDSPGRGLAITPQGPMLLVSADSRTSFQGSPRVLVGGAPGAGSAQVSYVLDTLPPAGRYKLFARLEHQGRMFLTDFTVDLP